MKEAAQEAPLDLAFDLLTFQQLDRLAYRLERELIAKKIRSGDIVALRHPPCAEALALFFAVWRVGASICPLSQRLPLSEIEPHLKRLKSRIFIDSFPIHSNLLDANATLNDPSALFFTSGSTSLPKIAVLSLSSLINNAKSAICKLDLKRGDCWLLNLPLYHVGGIGICLRSILAKSRIVLNPFEPSITHSSAVPTQLYRATPVYKRLRCLLLGGAPLSFYPEKIPCYLSYGLTEMGSIVCARLRPPQWNGHFDLGPPLPGKEILLLPDGEIAIRGNSLFQGYWEEGKIIKNEGWFMTRDLGRLTKTGGLSILGRKDRQFISGGENIQPEEIENALLTLPDVQEAFVAPIADPEFGQRPVAVVKAAKDAAWIRSQLLEKLPKFKIPVRFIFVDHIPKAGFKIDFKKAFAIVNKNIDIIS
ncbi:MAG TPA: AMP-binding protein [Chlamydiales bacterium]|nr:AMP-binding protein [Chlamydiales bacterium]